MEQILELPCMYFRACAIGVTAAFAAEANFFNFYTYLFLHNCPARVHHTIFLKSTHLSWRYSIFQWSELFAIGFTCLAICQQRQLMTYTRFGSRPYEIHQMNFLDALDGPA